MILLSGNKLQILFSYSHTQIPLSVSVFSQSSWLSHWLSLALGVIAATKREVTFFKEYVINKREHRIYKSPHKHRLFATNYLIENNRIRQTGYASQICVVTY